MNWDAISTIVEIISTVAVIVSLVYVGSQVRTGNRLARAEAWRSPNSDLNALNASFGVDPMFRKAIALCHYEDRNRSQFQVEETYVLDLYMVSLTNIYEQLFREVREGILPERALLDFGARNILSSRYYQESWPGIKQNFGTSFVRHFEKIFVPPAPEKTKLGCYGCIRRIFSWSPASVFR